MSGTDQLTALAARLRAIPTLGPEIAKAVAPDLLALNKADAAAGTTPGGAPWALTQKGTRALPHAADGLSTRVIGDVVYLVISGFNVFHNKTRRILPYRGVDLPPAYRAAVVSAAKRVVGGAP